MRSFFWGVVLTIGIAIPIACSSGTDKNPNNGNQGSGGTPDTVLCEDACILVYPGAEPTYRAFRSCLTCDACFDICSANVKDLCEEAVDGGCSIAYMADPKNLDPNGCNLCVNSDCASKQDPATHVYEGVCKAQGDACTAQNDCVLLNNCIVTCINNGGPSTGGSGGMVAQGGAGP